MMGASIITHHAIDTVCKTELLGKLPILAGPIYSNAVEKEIKYFKDISYRVWLFAGASRA